MFKAVNLSDKAGRSNPTSTGTRLDYAPTNATVILDSYFAPVSTTHTNGQNSAEYRLKRYIGNLSESSATQLHTFLCDSPLSRLQGNGIEQARFTSRLSALHLPSTDDVRFEYLAKQAMTRSKDVFELIRDRISELEVLSEDSPVCPNKYITSPTELRNLELEGLLVPNLRQCISACLQRCPKLDGKHSVADIGSWDGRLITRLSKDFDDIFGFEPYPDRFPLLERRFERVMAEPIDGVERRFVAHPMSVQELVDQNYQFARPPSIILLSHVLYFVRDQDYDLRVLDWAARTIRPGGAVLVVLNSSDRTPGTRRHFRNHVGAEEKSRETLEFASQLQSKGYQVDLYQFTLRLRAEGTEGRTALHELMYFMVPGSERRQRPGLIQHYTDRFVFTDGESTRYGLDHTLDLLVLRKSGDRSSIRHAELSDATFLRGIDVPETAEDISNAPNLYSVAAPIGMAQSAAPLPSELSRHDIQGIWREYKSPESPLCTSETLRNQLMVHYLPIVRFNATRVHAKLPEEVELDDLISAGTFGLMDAIEAYDPERGAKFETYCAPRIRGAILDELRSTDWAPRLVRSRAHQLETALAELEVELDGESPDDDTLARKLNVDKAGLERIRRDGSAVTITSLDKKISNSDDDNGSSQGSLIAAPRTASPDTRMMIQEAREQLFKGLTAQQAEILSLLIGSEPNMKDVALRVDLSESRISQMTTEIFRLIKARFTSVSDPGKFVWELREELQANSPRANLVGQKLTDDLVQFLDAVNARSQMEFELGSDKTAVAAGDATLSDGEQRRLDQVHDQVQANSEKRLTTDNPFGFEFTS